MNPVIYWIIGLILLAIVVYYIVRANEIQARLDQQEREDAEKLHKELERMRQRRAKVYGTPEVKRVKVPSISTPVPLKMKKPTSVPRPKIEQRVTTEYTTSPVRAEDSGTSSMDGFALGMLVGHISSSVIDDDMQSRAVFSSGGGGDFGGGGAYSSWDSSSSSDSSSTSSSDDSSSSSSSYD